MAVKHWEGQPLLYEIDYDIGTNQPVTGETLNVVGAAAETCIIQAWSVTSGTWGGNNAVGKLWVYSASDEFVANFTSGDDLENSSSALICNTTSGKTDKSGDWQVSGNWGTVEDPSIPVANDFVIFDSRSTQAVTGGTALAETGGVSLDLLHVKNGFTADIGTTSARLHINPDRVIFEGTGTMWLECSAANVTTDSDIDLVIMNSIGGTLNLSSDVNTDAWTAEFTEVWAVRGTLVLSDDTNIYKLFMMPYNNKESNVTVTIGIDCFDDKDGDAAMEVYMHDGKLTTDSKIAILHLHNGTLNFGTDLGSSPEEDLDIVTSYIFGGTLNWYPDDTLPIIQYVYMFGGILDASGILNNDRTKNVCNVPGRGFIFSGATMTLNNEKGNITIGTDLHVLGGTVVFDSNAEFSIAYNTL